MAINAQNSSLSPERDGLRSRKKAKRRESILENARILFAKKGIQATTMAEIADAVDVSTPTVFNYFGNKDGILIALITEGSTRSRAQRLSTLARDDADFGTIVSDTLTEISSVTLDIAEKRVWRYAEAAAIRHPTTDLAQKYAANDSALRGSIRVFFEQYDVALRSGEPADTDLLARIFFDVWNSAFFDLIKEEDMTLTQHASRLEGRIRPLCTLLFQDEFLESPVLKERGAIDEPC